MTSQQLQSALSEPEQTDSGAGANPENASVRLFIFSVGTARYALAPEQVQEIIANLEVYPLPACPPYIAGLVNCHGFPYTAFDIHVLFENERLDYSMFLVLKIEGDSLAIGCTEVDELVDVPAAAIVPFSDSDADGRFATAICEYQQERVLMLSIPQLLKRLELDLG